MSLARDRVERQFIRHGDRGLAARAKNFEPRPDVE